MTERWDDSICLIWLARHLHPAGFACPPGHRPERRVLRPQGDFPAYRCLGCDGSDTRLTNTVLKRTRQRPATLGLLLRGMAQGEPTARFARELGLSRQQLHTLRQRVQANLHATVPTSVMTGTAVEADERSQNAGEQTPAPSRSQRPATPTRPSAQRPWPVCQ